MHCCAEVEVTLLPFDKFHPKVHRIVLGRLAPPRPAERYGGQRG